MKRNSSRSPDHFIKVENVDVDKKFLSHQYRTINDFSEESQRNKLLNPNELQKKSIHSSRSSMCSSGVEEGKLLNRWIANIFDRAIVNLEDESQSQNSNLPASKSDEKLSKRLSLDPDHEAYPLSRQRNIDKLHAMSNDDKQRLHKDDDEQHELQNNNNFNIMQFKTAEKMPHGKHYLLTKNHNN
jgi:hypothetical protein